MTSRPLSQAYEICLLKLRRFSKAVDRWYSRSWLGAEWQLSGAAKLRWIFAVGNLSTDCGLADFGYRDRVSWR